MLELDPFMEDFTRMISKGRNLEREYYEALIHEKDCLLTAYKSQYESKLELMSKELEEMKEKCERNNVESDKFNEDMKNNIMKYEKQIEACNAKITNSQCEVETFKKEINLKKDELVKIKNELNEIKTQSNKSLKGKDKELIALKKQLDEKDKICEQKTSKHVQSIELELKNKEKRINSLISEVEKLEKSTKINDELIEKLKKDAKITNKDKMKLECKIKEYQAKIELLNVKYEDLRAINNEITSETVKIKEENEEMKYLYNKGNKKDDKKLYEKIKNENLKLLDEISEYESKMDVLDQKNQDLSTKLYTFEKEHKSIIKKNKNNDSLQNKQIEKKEQEYYELKYTLESKLNKLKEENENLQVKIKTLNTEKRINKNSEIVNKLNENIKNITECSNIKEKENQKLIKENERLLKLVEKNRDNITDSKKINKDSSSNNESSKKSKFVKFDVVPETIENIDNILISDLKSVISDNETSTTNDQNNSDSNMAIEIEKNIEEDLRKSQVKQIPVSKKLTKATLNKSKNKNSKSLYSQKGIKNNKNTKRNKIESEKQMSSSGSNTHVAKKTNKDSKNEKSIEDTPIHSSKLEIENVSDIKSSGIFSSLQKTPKKKKKSFSFNPTKKRKITVPKNTLANKQNNNLNTANHNEDDFLKSYESDNNYQDKKGKVNAFFDDLTFTTDSPVLKKINKK